MRWPRSAPLKRGGELQVNELLPASPEAATAHGLTERDVFEATDYYKTARGQQPGGATRMLFSHAQKTLAWDAFAFAEVLLTQPVMVVVGRKSVPLAPIAMGWKSTGVQRLRSIVSWFRWRISHTTSCMTNRKPFVKRWTRCCRFSPRTWVNNRWKTP